MNLFNEHINCKRMYQEIIKMPRMKITKVIIRQNKRLLDKGTSSVEWTPESDIQVIIGGNGNGKSSLGRELSPLPATKADYEPNGYKEVWCETEVDTFISITDFDAKHIHSFIRVSDNVNLNDGGTAKVQLQLIKEHLKFTPKHHELLCGDIKFTQISANERKALFTQMGDFNVDYAIELFDKLKKSLNESKGAYSHTSRKLLEEQNQQLSEEEIDAIKGRLRRYSEKINKALSFRDNFVVDDRIHSEIQRIEENIELVINEARKHWISHVGFDSFSDLDAEIGKWRNSRDSIQEQIDLKQSALEQNSSTLNKISDGAIKKKELEQQLESLDKELATLDSKVPDNVDLSILDMYTLDDFKNAYKSLESSLSEFDVIFKNLQSLKEYKFTKEKIEEVQSSHTELVKYINHKGDILRITSNYVRQVESHDPTKCPKCEHQWIEGVSDSELKEKKAQVSKLEKLLEVANERLKERDIELEASQEYQITKGSYYRLVSENHHLVKTNLINKINEEDLEESPLTYSEKFRNFIKTLSYLGKKKSLGEKRLSLMEQLKFCNDLETLATGNDLTTDSLEKLNVEIDKLHEKEIECNSKVRELENLRVKCQYMEHHRQTIERLESELEEAYVNLSKYNVNNMVDEMVMECEKESTELTKKLTMFNSSKAIIDHLSKTVDDLVMDQEIIKVAMEELGPEKGLIAESLNSFMGEFINQMNLVIGSIWTTPLKVLPCSVSKKGLDYLFPVMSYDKNRTTKDVKLRSEGEMEIIDFTFTLIAASCMGLEGYPLFLDETGRPFTENHKVRFYDYLKLLADSGKVSTIFLISHYIATVEILTRAEVVNLDPTGITVKSNQNRNFKINE